MRGRSFLRVVSNRIGSIHLLASFYFMSKTNSVEWHEQCLKNLKAALEKKEEAVRTAQSEHYRLTKTVYGLEQQIARAKRQGKKSFDADRYSPLG